MSDHRATLPAPIQYRNPQSAASPRYDDEHRGPAVADAYGLSRCWIDLMEASRDWPMPDKLPSAMIELAQTVPEGQRQEWLRALAASEEVIRKISYAMRSGGLPIWVAPKDGPERLVDPDAMLEIDAATIKAGCYRPHNDRGWLFGRPLFVKINDWSGFVESVQRQMMARTPSTMAVDDPGDAGWIAGLPGGWIDVQVAVIRFCQLVTDRLETSEMARWIPVPNVAQHRRLWGGTEEDALHNIRLNAHVPAVFQRDFLRGVLSASLFDGHNFKTLPKAAFANLSVVNNALMFGTLGIDPLWSDEWWCWNDRKCAIPKAQFEAWLASTEPTRLDGLPAEISLADEDIIPALLVREPASRSRISLSEAVSWIAFRLALDADRLEMALYWDRLADGDLQEVQRKVTLAVADVVAAGADGRVAFFGRHIESRDEKGAINAAIDPIQLDDYRAFVIGRDDLLYGDGLHRTYKAKNDTHFRSSERRDLFSTVTVSRANLLTCFPRDPHADDCPAGPSSIKAEAECRQWLKEMFALEPKQKPKRDFQSDAMRRYSGRLSVRGFQRAWAAEAQLAGRATPGRKS